MIDADVGHWLATQWNTWGKLISFVGGAITTQAIKYLFDRIPRARLSLSLADATGELTTFGRNGPPAFFYHIVVANKGASEAKNVNVHLTKVYYNNVKEDIKHPLFLTWANYEGCSLDINPDSARKCNFGYIYKRQTDFRFEIDLCKEKHKQWPPGFHGFINAGETMCAEVKAESSNATPKYFCIKVYWDGGWSEIPEKMKGFLTIEEIRSCSRTKISVK